MTHMRMEIIKVKCKSVQKIAAKTTNKQINTQTDGGTDRPYHSLYPDGQ